MPGEVIDAQKHENVTMLFSDIVGFTSICSTATPFMVITMLQDLYTKFDTYCGQLDVYKVGYYIRYCQNASNVIMSKGGLLYTLLLECK